MAAAATVHLEKIPADIPVSGDCDLDWIIYRAGQREGVDPRFIHAVIRQESQYHPKATSPVGARGLMQLMPATAKRFNCDDPGDQTCNVEAGTKYLAWLLKRFDGDVKLALAGYNAGEGAVDKYQGVPPYPETQNYVNKIVTNYGKTFHPILPPEEVSIEFHLADWIARKQRFAHEENSGPDHSRLGSCSSSPTGGLSFSSRVNTAFPLELLDKPFYGWGFFSPSAGFSVAQAYPTSTLKRAI